MWFSQGLFGMANSQIPMINIWDDHGKDLPKPTISFTLLSKHGATFVALGLFSDPHDTRIEDHNINECVQISLTALARIHIIS